MHDKTRGVLCAKGLIQELLWNNLRKGSVQMQDEIRQLLCILTNDNPTATNDLCNLIMDRINISLEGHVISSDLGSSIRHEISLLASLLQIRDECWEMRLRCMVELFLKACEDTRSPLVMESVILPCLKIWYTIVKPENTTKQAKVFKTIARERV